MFRTSICVSLNLATVVTAYGQLTHTVQGAVRHATLLDLGDGHTLQICNHDPAFIGDTSYCELVWTQQDQAVINALRFRSTDPFPYIGVGCDIAELNDGFVVTGGRCISGPFIMKLGADGELEWSGSLAPLPFDQLYMKRVFAAGDIFTAYTSTFELGGCGGLAGNQIYRINGESSATVWNCSLTTTQIQQGFTVMSGVDAGNSHVLGGSGFSGNIDGQGAMLVVMSDSGATWMNCYEIPTNDIVQFDGAVDLERTADGNVVFTGAVVHDGILHGLVMKVDLSGSVLWSTELDHVNSVLALRGAHELPGGDLLVAGYSQALGSDYENIVIRLTSLGNIVWQKRFAPPNEWFMADFFSNDVGELKLITETRIIELDSTGTRCGFVDISAITATPFAPVVTSIPFTNSAVDLSFVPENLPERIPMVSWTLGCDPLGSEDRSRNQGLTAHPVPSTDFVQLGKLGEVAVSERVIIRDIAGAIRADLSYGTALDLRAFASGVYFCELPRIRQHIRIVRQ